MLEYQKSSAAKASHCAGRVSYNINLSTAMVTFPWLPKAVAYPLSRAVSRMGGHRFLVLQHEVDARTARRAWRTNKAGVDGFQRTVTPKKYYAKQSYLRLYQKG